MSIRFQLLLYVILGYILVSLAFIFSTNMRDNIQEEASAEAPMYSIRGAIYHEKYGVVDREICHHAILNLLNGKKYFILDIDQKTSQYCEFCLCHY